MTNEPTVKGVLITGGSMGLGAAIARAFLESGASVFLCARGETALQGTAEELKTSLGVGDDRVRTRAVDVIDFEAVDAAIAECAETFPGFDTLVTCAGVYGPTGPIDDVDWQAWMDAVAINLYGTVYASRAVLPHFRSRGRGKIIHLSGGGATSPLPNLSAYAASKAGVVRFTETLARELSGSGIEVNAVAPGALDTRLLDQVLEAGPDRIGQAFYDKMVGIKESGGAPLSRGADLCVYLASEASDGVTGKLISALWDPWDKFGDHLDDIQSTDIYSLRRIVPRERGLGWGEVE